MARTKQFIVFAVLALAVLAIGVHAKKKSKTKADETVTHKVGAGVLVQPTGDHIVRVLCSCNLPRVFLFKYRSFLMWRLMVSLQVSGRRELRSRACSHPCKTVTALPRARTQMQTLLLPCLLHLLAGRVVMGLFGNTVPKTVRGQETSSMLWPYDRVTLTLLVFGLQPMPCL